MDDWEERPMKYAEIFFLKKGYYSHWLFDKDVLIYCL
jgi:hypothetical protein